MIKGLGRIIEATARDAPSTVSQRVVRPGGPLGLGPGSGIPRARNVAPPPPGRPSFEEQTRRMQERYDAEMGTGSFRNYPPAGGRARTTSNLRFGSIDATSRSVTGAALGPGAIPRRGPRSTVIGGGTPRTSRVSYPAWDTYSGIERPARSVISRTPTVPGTIPSPRTTTAPTGSRSPVLELPLRASSRSDRSAGAAAPAGRRAKETARVIAGRSKATTAAAGVGPSRRPYTVSSAGPASTSARRRDRMGGRMMGGVGIRNRNPKNFASRFFDRADTWGATSARKAARAGRDSGAANRVLGRRDWRPPMSQSSRGLLPAGSGRRRAAKYTGIGLGGALGTNAMLTEPPPSSGSRGLRPQASGGQAIY